MNKILILSAITMALSACSMSPPKPPTVDGKSTTEVNSYDVDAQMGMQAEIEELRNKLIIHETTIAMPTAEEVDNAENETLESKLITITFPYNKTTLNLTAEKKAELLPYIHNANRIELRGRTDGKRRTNRDEYVALHRAISAKNYLISQGVPSDIISINYVSAQDYLNSNQSAANRQENRRVEIELFY
jgi:outer membrane protein OmpA-like peptidoglycan-associated protein